MPKEPTTRGPPLPGQPGEAPVPPGEFPSLPVKAAFCSGCPPPGPGVGADRGGGGPEEVVGGGSGWGGRGGRGGKGYRGDDGYRRHSEGPGETGAPHPGAPLVRLAGGNPPPGCVDCHEISEGAWSPGA